MVKFSYLKKLVTGGIIPVILLTIIIPFAIAQVDDPSRDIIPENFRIPTPQLYNPLVTVTLNDYDNFNMGTDYAEGHVSMNPLDPLQIFNAWNINGTHYTFDGGLNWFVNNPAFPNAAGDPVTAYDSLGNLYYETMKSPVTACWIAKSTNNGVNWLFTNVSAMSGNDKNWLCADQTSGPYTNYIYTIMTGGGGANLWRSTNQGVSYSAAQVLTPHGLPGAMVCVGANGSISGGSVYAVTHSGTNAAGTYNFFLSTNGGANFVSMSSLSVSNVIGNEVSGRSTVQAMRTRPYPMIAADNSWGPYRGRLYLVYASNDPVGSGNKSDIWIKYSTNQGSNWSTTMRVNDDLNPQLHNSFHPAIWCDKETGKLSVMFYDSRLCPTNDSMDVFATYSTNGGESFVPNQRISNKTFRITVGSNSPPSYQGDYNSITSNSKTSMVIWADFRNNSYGSYSAYFPDFALRLNPTQDSINNANGSVYIKVVVPAVKLYTDTVLVSAAITPTPGSGSFSITYPGVNKFTAFPDSLLVKVTANNVTPATYTLTVTAKGPNGTPVHTRTATIVAASTISGIAGNEEPVTYSLSQNFPNPFNPVTRINYSVAKQSDVTITIFDIVGKEITRYSQPRQTAGNHFVMFNAANLSTGVYYYKIQAGDFTEVKKMMLIK